MAPGGSPAENFVDIWDYNLDKEFEKVRDLATDYHYIAVDTEYPGLVARPLGDFRHNHGEYQYLMLKSNVDMLRIIQIGITFFDEYGRTPPGAHTFQFHFKFSMSSDMYAQDSIELLQEAGIQFDEHARQGIDPIHFAELLITSGLILSRQVRWITFQGGYDFAYLVKLLTSLKLPREEAKFVEVHRKFFPLTYDVKYLMKSVKQLKGGLQDVALTLELERVGPQHQAGSDAYLTGRCFFRMREMYFDNKIDDTKYCGFVAGFGTTVNGPAVQSMGPTNVVTAGDGGSS